MTAIAFLDDDHVMTLARLMLSARGPDDERWLQAFFAPESIDLSALLELGAGLRRQDGVEIRLADDDARALAAATVLMFRRGQVTRKAIEACPGLRLIQRLGEDASSIDVAAAHERGVEVSCLPRRTLRYTAEHALLLMLALSKRLLAADRAVRSGGPAVPRPSSGDGVAYNWPGLDGVGGLVGRTLGIVGCGEVGALVARRARAFEMRVIYADRARLAPERERALEIEYRPLEQLLTEADIVSIHVPGTAANERLIGTAALARMRPDALLVNTSRGRVVDEDALYHALVQRRIAGAGLDVHAHEPRLASDRFCQLDNVILTPHVSGGSRRNTVAEIEAMFDNIRAALAGQSPRHGRVPAALT